VRPAVPALHETGVTAEASTPVAIGAVVPEKRAQVQQQFVNMVGVALGFAWEEQCADPNDMERSR
jgi:3-oxoacyl-[acyl-carrier-protein] synthase III